MIIRNVLSDDVSKFLLLEERMVDTLYSFSTNNALPAIMVETVAATSSSTSVKPSAGLKDFVLAIKLFILSTV